MRRTVAAILVAIGFLAAGCGGDDNGAEAGAEPTGTPTPKQDQPYGY